MATDGLPTDAKRAYGGDSFTQSGPISTHLRAAPPSSTLGSSEQELVTWNGFSIEWFYEFNVEE